jgi:hypothetical protein
MKPSTSTPTRTGTQPSGSPTTILPQLSSYELVEFTSTSTMDGLDANVEFKESERMAFRTAIAGTMTGRSFEYIYIFIYIFISIYMYSYIHSSM